MILVPGIEKAGSVAFATRPSLPLSFWPNFGGFQAEPGKDVGTTMMAGRRGNVMALMAPALKSGRIYLPTAPECQPVSLFFILLDCDLSTIGNGNKSASPYT